MDASLPVVRPDTAWLRGRATIAGIAGLVLLVIGGLFNHAQFFHSYLFGYLYWLGMGLGCVALVMIYHLTGGAWGVAARRVLEAASRTVPLLAVLFIPLLFGLHQNFSWTHADVLASEPVVRAKVAYLNVPFFVIRAVIYFAAWILMAFFLNRWSRAQDETGDPRLGVKMRALSGGGLVAWSFLVSFAGFDWIMSLDPTWFSTIFGMLVMVGFAFGALALTIVTVHFLSLQEGFRRLLVPTAMNDLGNLLLTFVMLWAYLSFSQLLIIWAGNLPDEIPWYLHRMLGGWLWVGVALAAFYFATPFCLLLSRARKRYTGPLAAVALMILVMRAVDMFFMVMPEFYRNHLAIHWMDVAAFFGIGGVWLAVFAWELARRPLVPRNDPELILALARKPH